MPPEPEGDVAEICVAGEEGRDAPSGRPASGLNRFSGVAVTPGGARVSRAWSTDVVGTSPSARSVGVEQATRLSRARRRSSASAAPGDECAARSRRQAGAAGKRLGALGDVEPLVNPGHRLRSARGRGRATPAGRSAAIALALHKECRSIVRIGEQRDRAPAPQRAPTSQAARLLGDALGSTGAQEQPSDGGASNIRTRLHRPTHGNGGAGGVGERFCSISSALMVSMRSMPRPSR